MDITHTLDIGTAHIVVGSLQTDPDNGKLFTRVMIITDSKPIDQQAMGNYLRSEGLVNSEHRLIMAVVR